MLVPVSRDLALTQTGLWLPEGTTDHGVVVWILAIAPDFVHFELDAASPSLPTTMRTDHYGRLGVLGLLGPRDHFFNDL